MKTKTQSQRVRAVEKSKSQKTTLSARDRIKPRGLAGCMKGKIHYDEDADIFNLGL